MFSYTAYGLGIQSSFSLPELVAAEAAADVVVRLGRVDCQAPMVDDEGLHCWATAGEVCYVVEHVGAFLIRSGREIIIDPEPGVAEQVLRPFLLGRILATLLHQRGLLVLHASAVAINGGVIAFLGGKGWGKSTLAAAMHVGGHDLVADDVVALDIASAGKPRVFPSFPQVKLWPDVAIFLGNDPDTLPRLHPRLEKRARRIAHGFPQTPLPLRRLYVLDEGQAQQIEPLQPQAAFVELVRHSYVGSLLGATGTAALHFRQCAWLATAVPICRLQRQRRLSALLDLVLSVQGDVAQTSCDGHHGAAPA